MKYYKVENPQFTDTLQITETTDTSHADNINRAPKQAFENTLYLEKSKVAADGGDVSDTVIKTEGEAGDEDYPVPAAGDTPKTFLAKTKKFISNFKDWMTGVCMLGAIVNNCVTDNPSLPLSAAQGKALMDLYTQLYSDLISVKMFEIEVTTKSTKDPASGLYIGTCKLIDSPSYPKGENILAVIPYGARSKLDAGRSAMVAYRTDDTFISVNSPNQPNEVFVVNVAVFYSFSNS